VKNLGQMMKQAQQMQQKMADMQSQLEAAEITGASGGGMVRVTLSGKGDLKALKIDPALLAENEVEVLEDLIIAAHADARTRVEAYMKDEMAKITGGLSLPPGINLPF
jgi:DNA-binding YbaB/EbfC family protein